MVQDEKRIRQMIQSPDKESIHLAVNMLQRNLLGFTQTKCRSILDKVPLEHRIIDYSDICLELKEKELTIEDFAFMSEDLRKKTLASAKLLQVAKLLNGKWVPKWNDSAQSKWFPYFDPKKAFGGLVFLFSIDHHGGLFAGLVMFKDEKTADFVGRTFISLYEDLM